MKQLFRSLALLGLLVPVAVPAAAGELQLTIANGRATLIAQDVPVRQILAEWARLGQTKIINGEKLGGPPLTLHIVDKPEREVLETVLRSASGYVAAPRALASAGASVFESVMIMPTSRPPAVTASAPQFNNQRQGFQPPPMPQQAMPVDDDEGEPSDQGVVPPPGVMPPGGVPPGGVMPGGVNGVPQQQQVYPQVQPYPGAVPQPTVQPQPGMPQQPAQQNPMIAPRPGVLPNVPQATPGNPYQPQLPVRRPGQPGGEGI